ncbi:MAG: threonylcarbamoyl-AMP synthase [Firmicutes bacterium]|nr:threonylcarbamoyl-AMP synthase [Bacillota bacterium]
METKWIKTQEISKKQYDAALREASDLLHAGDLVAFPTETVYGLGGNAFDPEAAKKIYAAKGRPSDNPLIVHISHIDQMDDLVEELTPLCRRLAFEFWPGPLTMILPKSDKVPHATTGGLDTVAVRMPAHGVALDLIDETNLPIAAPSANLSGKPSPTRGEHVFHDLNGRIPMVLDGGEVEIGLESTIIDLSRPEPVILRPGRITYDDIKPFAPRLKGNYGITAADLDKPKAPGMKYKHYAPDGDVCYLPEGEEGITAFANAAGKKALLISAERWQELQGAVNPDYLFVLGSKHRLEEVAHNLFHAFRECDREQIDTVFIEAFPDLGFGEALMNRIQKAAYKK